jgi:hypothetical protein
MAVTPRNKFRKRLLGLRGVEGNRHRHRKPMGKQA